MPTVSKEVAEREIERLRKQRWPRMYCVVRYRDGVTGRDEYAFCQTLEMYYALCDNDRIGGMDILWASHWFVQDSRDAAKLLAEKKGK